MAFDDFLDECEDADASELSAGFIGMGFGLMSSLPFMFRMYSAPCGLISLLLGLVSSVFMLCCCIRRCSGDCYCIKRARIFFGMDKFEEFSLHVMVFGAKAEVRGKYCVRLTAGGVRQKTQYSSKGTFLEELCLHVPQGAEKVNIDIVLNDFSSSVVARSVLDIEEDILSKIKGKEDGNLGELTLAMTPKMKGVLRPEVHLSLIVEKGGDEAGEENDGRAPFRSREGSVTFDAEYFLQRERTRMPASSKSSDAKSGSEADMSGSGLEHDRDLEVHRRACSGAVDMLPCSIMGKRKKSVYLGVIGPPTVRRWQLGIWKNADACKSGDKAMIQVEMLRISSVQIDPTCETQFYIKYYDDRRFLEQLTLRCLDRPRDVWVDLLQRMATQLHELRGRGSSSSDARKKEQGDRRLTKRSPT